MDYVMTIQVYTQIEEVHTLTKLHFFNGEFDAKFRCFSVELTHELVKYDQ